MPTNVLPQPRKTPVQARSSATVDAILEAAARILETEGFEGYTTNAIARLAGVSIGSLYQYFPNKDAVTAALVLTDTEAVADRMEATLAAYEGRPTTDCIDALIEDAVCHQLDRPVLARLIDMEAYRLGTEPRLDAAHQRVLGVVRGLLMRSGIPLPFDLETTTQDVFALSHGITDFAGMHGETDRERLKTRIRYAVLSYLGLPSS